MRLVPGLCLDSCSTLQVLVNTAIRSGEHSPTDISYVAVHGTGTPLGDPIEVGALSAALARQATLASHGVTLGSVKVRLCHAHPAFQTLTMEEGLIAQEHPTTSNSKRYDG